MASYITENLQALGFKVATDHFENKILTSFSKSNDEARSVVIATLIFA